MVRQMESECIITRVRTPCHCAVDAVHLNLPAALIPQDLVLQCVLYRWHQALTPALRLLENQ
jgi:hypothetical protein